MLIRKIISEYYDPEYDGVVKTVKLYFLFIPIYEKSTLTFNNDIIDKFIIRNKINKIGFNVDNKDKEIETSEPPTDNQEG